MLIPQLAVIMKLAPETSKGGVRLRVVDNFYQSIYHCFSALYIVSHEIFQPKRLKHPHKSGAKWGKMVKNALLLQM